MKDIPVIFLTAINDRANIEAVLKLKPAGYFLKPAIKDNAYPIPYLSYSMPILFPIYLIPCLSYSLSILFHTYLNSMPILFHTYLIPYISYLGGR